MRHWTELLGTLGPVQTFDYPYMIDGRKRPDLSAVLIAAHRDAVHAAQSASDGPLVLIGKSMGSRIGCHVSLAEKVSALVCLGYPLCGGGDPTKLRDKVLREITTPILFVQGTRDKLCPLELLENVRCEMSAKNELLIVESGDHSLAVTKSQLKAAGETQEDVNQRILRAIEMFVNRHTHAAAHPAGSGDRGLQGRRPGDA